MPASTTAPRHRCTPSTCEQTAFQRPIEEDTRILAAHYRRINEVPFLLEEWTFEGIRGSSVVFLTEHVAGVDDAALGAFLIERAGIQIGGSVTIARRGGYVFLNFDFQAT